MIDLFFWLLIKSEEEHSLIMPFNRLLVLIFSLLILFLWFHIFFLF